MKDVLITGRGVITGDDVSRIKAQGFSVDRLSALDGSDHQLITAVTGKRGYICAGHERVTEAVVENADILEVISFPGSGYAEYVPGWRLATDRGIAVCAAIGANAPSVADYTLLLILDSLRNFAAKRAGLADPRFPTRECAGLTIGLIGLGYSGLAVADRARGLGMKVLATVRRPPSQSPSFVEITTLEDLLKNSDVVSLHVSPEHGSGVLQEEHLARMKDGSLLVNVAFPDAVDWPALRAELLNGRLRAAFDAPPANNYQDLAADVFIASDVQAAYNAIDSNRRVRG
jgi:phosphoglycerate dehydrogenase-like enzyme